MAMEPQVRKKRFGLWILIAIVIAAVAAVFDPTQVIVGTLLGDAFFQSRPTRYWARALRADPASQSDAQLRLEQGGPEAVPVLTSMLDDYPSEQDAELRWKSAEILAKLGPDASPEGPTMVEALR